MHDNDPADTRKRAHPLTRYLALGFSLVELMIVLAIIAVTAAYAVPAYQDYIARGRVGEGLSLAAPIRLAVAENAALGLPFDSGHQKTGVTANVASIDVGAQGGEIIIRYTSRVAPPEANTLVLVPSMNDGTDQRTALRVGTPTNGTLMWECFAAGKAGRTDRESTGGTGETHPATGPVPATAATLPARLAMAACR